MKNRILLCIFVSSLLFVSGCTHTTDERIYGVWNAVEPTGETVVLEFRPGNEIYIDEDGDAEIGRYAINWTTDPIEIDFFWEDYVIRSIIEFLDDHRIRLADNSPDSPRPADFGQATLILQRNASNE